MYNLNLKKLKLKSSCDVLVLGSGIAGISAAVSAGEAGVSVIIACKGSLFSGSSFYPGTWGLGLIGPENAGDEEDLLRTIEEVGCGMARRELAEGLVRGISPAVKRAEDMGISFEKARAGAGQREYIPCFDHKHRAWRGLRSDSCRRAFSAKLEELGTGVLSGWEAIELVKDSGRVCGAVLSSGQELMYVGCRAVILATGGCGGLFSRHICSGDAEGLGQSLALDAGCRLINMEFMQIMPAYLSPVRGTVFNEKTFRFCSLEAEGRDILKGRDSAALLQQRSGHGPFTSRLEDRAVDLAILESKGGVTVRYSRVLMDDPPEFIKTYFDWLCETRGLTADDPAIIGLFAHASNGGVCIEPDASTGTEGLWAAGEVTGGMHGADRIGGLSAANGLVYGLKAGSSAAAFAVNAPQAPENYGFSMLGNADWETYFRELREIMTDSAMVCRSEQGLNTALSQVRMLAKKAELRPCSDISAVTGARRLHGQLQTAECILRAALLRRESRGSHYRVDFPDENPELARRISIRKENSAILAEFEN
ncbi:MAG: FAD-binding protein [Candidatus Limivicinus sp.]|jgi:succinate dehydrogenase/fumarate reductase flavoprotein subunit